MAYQYNNNDYLYHTSYQRGNTPRNTFFAQHDTPPGRTIAANTIPTSYHFSYHSDTLVTPVHNAVLPKHNTTAFQNIIYTTPQNFYTPRSNPFSGNTSFFASPPDTISPPYSAFHTPPSSPKRAADAEPSPLTSKTKNVAARVKDSGAVFGVKVSPMTYLSSQTVLLLNLDHDLQWSDSRRQEFLTLLRKDNCSVFASTAADAHIAISRYKPTIILLIGATTLNHACKVNKVIEMLNHFSKDGGTVIFGGVPWAFCPQDFSSPPERISPTRKADNEEVKLTKGQLNDRFVLFDSRRYEPPPSPSHIHSSDIFKIFSLHWTVSGDTSRRNHRMIDSTAFKLLPWKALLKGTYLTNVPVGARMYRTLETTPASATQIVGDEECVVACQNVGKGKIMYVGLEELWDDEGMGLLVAICRFTAEGGQIESARGSEEEIKAESMGTCPTKG